VALREAESDPRVAALCLVAMPHRGGLETDVVLPDLPPPERMRSFDRPVLFLVGSLDFHVPVEGLRPIAALLPKARLEVVEGADHYFAGHERQAAERVADFMGEASL
jgi:pimeloyl-ACP methyl ester carboxylesterase